MADPISVQCPHCKVKLKLKAAPPAGKKVGCPKCKKPFPVKAPPKKKESDDDFLDALDDLSEEDYEAPEDEDSEEQEEEAPARSTMRSKSGGTTKKGGKGKKGRSKKSSVGPLLAIIGGSVAALALVAGLVYLLMNLPAGAKGIRSASGEFIAFAPADAELFIAARPADIIASPCWRRWFRIRRRSRASMRWKSRSVFRSPKSNMSSLRSKSIPMPPKLCRRQHQWQGTP